MVCLHIQSRVPAIAINRQHYPDKGVLARNDSWQSGRLFPQRRVHQFCFEIFFFPLLTLSIEYYEARSALGDTTISEGVYEALYHRPFAGGLRSLLQGFLNNSPFHFQIFTILRNPASFSLTAMTLLQTTSSHLYYTIWRLLDARRGFIQNAEAIRDYFDYLQRKSAIVDGTIDFGEGEKIKGMKIEFR